MLFILPVVVLPSLWIVHLALTGQAQDIHLPTRGNRLVPLALTTLASMTSVVALFALHAPLLLQRLALISTCQLAVCLGVTTSWKISMHSAAASTAAVVLSGVQPWLIAPIWLTAIAIAWSRLRLRRHTPMQVAAGGLLGVFSCSLLL
jgi:membrane-associated phospholipid phosphatase